METERHSGIQPSRRSHNLSSRRDLPSPESIKGPQGCHMQWKDFPHEPCKNFDPQNHEIKQKSSSLRLGESSICSTIYPEHCISSVFLPLWEVLLFQHPGIHYTCILYLLKRATGDTDMEKRIQYIIKVTSLGERSYFGYHLCHSPAESSKESSLTSLSLLLIIFNVEIKTHNFISLLLIVRDKTYVRSLFQLSGLQ